MAWFVLHWLKLSFVMSVPLFHSLNGNELSLLFLLIGTLLFGTLVNVLCCVSSCIHLFVNLFYLFSEVVNWKEKNVVELTLTKWEGA